MTTLDCFAAVGKPSSQAPTSLTQTLARVFAGFARVATGARVTRAAPVAEAVPTVYFANHTSHADFVLLWSVLAPSLRARTRPVAAADYWLGSRLRRFMALKVFRALLVEREGRRRSEAGSGPLQAMADCLQAGESLILFPEGTRNTGGDGLLPFRSGLFHLAQRCPQARLVPVWIDNLHRVLPKGCVVPVPLACSLAFGAPLERVAGEPMADFLARAQAAVQALAETNATHVPTR